MTCGKLIKGHNESLGTHKFTLSIITDTDSGVDGISTQNLRYFDAKFCTTIERCWLKFPLIASFSLFDLQYNYEKQV